MCTTKLSPTARGRLALGVLQHAGRVDGDVAVRVAEDGEDVGGRRGDGALDLHAFGHGIDPVRESIVAVLVFGCSPAGIRPSSVDQPIQGSARAVAGLDYYGRNMPPILRNAIAFIQENADADIGLDDIAAAVNVSPRSVQYAFRRNLGTTPLEYLRRVRLDRAHRDLKAADPANDTVTAIAGRWGFSHAGRFSLAYKAAFGTAPSDTLRAYPA